MPSSTRRARARRRRSSSSGWRTGGGATERAGVDVGLEAHEALDHALVERGKHRVEVDAAEARAAVGPEVRVAQPSPVAAARAAHPGNVLEHEMEAEAPAPSDGREPDVVAQRGEGR